MFFLNQQVVFVINMKRLDKYIKIMICGKFHFKDVKHVQEKKIM
jgi:hypothetical protein